MCLCLVNIIVRDREIGIDIVLVRVIVLALVIFRDTVLFIDFIMIRVRDIVLVRLIFTIRIYLHLLMFIVIVRGMSRLRVRVFCDAYRVLLL